MSDINTAAVDGLKALDSDRPIRKADIEITPFCLNADGLSSCSNRQTVVLYSLSLQTRRMHSVCTKALRSTWP